MVESLHVLSGTNRQRLRGEIQKLIRLTETHSPLDTFLKQALDIIHPLYSATASIFWIRDPDGAIQPISQKGFRSPPLTEKNVSALHRFALQYWQANTPKLGRQLDDQPQSLVSPLLSENAKPMGALQLVFADSNSHQRDLALKRSPPSPDTEHVYQQAALATASILQPAISKRLLAQSISLPQAEAGLKIVQQKITAIQRTIRTTIQQYLQSLSGASFESYDENQAFVRQVQSLLDANGLRTECPECGHPAILRCARNASVTSGVFVFDHYLPEGRTFHGGGKTLPEIRVVAKPPRRGRSSQP